MVNVRELSTAIYGAWRFAMLDRSAVQYFDNSEYAFWKSFNAAAIAAPAYILLVLLSLVDQPVTASDTRIVVVETISYVIGWVLFPLVMIAFTDAVGSGRYYLRFIAAWNWAIVIQVFLILAVTAFSASGSIPHSAAAPLSLMSLIAIMFYQGFIARVTLDIQVPQAVLIVVIDLGLGIGLNIVNRGMYQG